jgi:ankyrin repeat protein
MLLEADANPLYLTTSRKSAYDYAVKSGRKLIAFLIAEACVLQSMLQNDSIAVLLYLKEGAYINIRNIYGWTPLIYFVSKNEKLTVENLLKHPFIEKDASDYDGWTALHHAAARGFTEIVRLLLSSGVQTSLKTATGKSALALAIDTQRSEEVIKIIPSDDNEL